MSNTLEMVKVGFLYFKVLLSTEQYQSFCKAQKEDDQQTITTLTKKYPQLLNIWPFWGDIYSFDTSLDEIDYYEQWFMQNHRKLFPIQLKKVRILKEGEKITAKSGTVYITIRKENSLNTARQMYRKLFPALNKLLNLEAGTYIFGLRNDQDLTPKKTEQYERCIDVLYWRKYLELSPYKTISRAYYSKKPAWKDIKYKINKCHKASHKPKLKDVNIDDLLYVVKPSWTKLALI
jgi:hypothetical protein